MRLVRFAVLEESKERGIAASEEFKILLGESDIGRISLRHNIDGRAPETGHIGFTIFPKYRGRGNAKQACLLMQPLMLKRGMGQAILVCRNDNLPSCKTCTNLGAKLVKVSVYRGKTVHVYQWDLI